MNVKHSENPYIIRSILLFIVFFLFCTESYAQNFPAQAIFKIPEITAYSIVERSDWRRFDNGRYTGLVQNEIRGTILPDSDYFFRGNFLVLQSTLRDMRHSAQPVDAVIPVNFEIDNDGIIIFEGEDRGFPRMRNFPSLPVGVVNSGYKWRAEGVRAVDPFNSGEPAIIPFLAEYEYRGIDNYHGTPVYRINARYASRYRSEIPGANNFVSIQGRHNVDIFVRITDGLPIFMRDELDETYTMTNGSTIRFAGFTLTFRDGIEPMDRDEVLVTLEPDDLEESDIELVSIPEGIRLIIRDIRFIPDTAQFLPEETSRLDLIADALKQIPQRTFLVEGHTAATGRPSAEMDLSVQRAMRLIDELVKRGINANRFVYIGWGGTKPISDNSTEEGRAQNRRVEITILE
ncbi:MAG: OmpA family protein [Treponema sp.]|nr:OmpA family protein [Treponema sp.]